MKFFLKLKWFFYKKRKKYIIAIIILIIISILQLIPPKLVGIIIDQIEKEKFYKNNIILLLGLMIFIAILIYILRYIWRIFLFSAAYSLSIELRNKLYHVINYQSSNFYINYSSGDLMARATNDVDYVVFAAGEGVLALVDSLVIGFSVLIIMIFQISWQLTILSLLPILIMSIFIKKNGYYLHKHFYIAQSTFSLLNNQIQENITNIKMIKSFGLEQHQLSKFSFILKNNVIKNMKVIKINARFEPIIYLSIGLANFFAIGGGSWLILNKIITLGQLTSFIIYLGLMIWPMLAFAWMFNIVEKGNVSYNRIQQILKEKNKLKDGKLLIPKGPGNLNIFIKSFYYPNNKKFILNKINVLLSHGKILGICGPTGSGKSTLISLILRQFDINEGEIYFHNYPLTSIKLNQWRSRLAVVNQIPFLFSDTIEKNISFGKSKATIKQIEKVSKLACIHNEILLFPHGYKTEIGEKGKLLSSGQKQRLTIARALLLNFEILILDDALSTVDQYTANVILNNLYIFCHNKTMIIASNTLSSLKIANEILVLKKGNIDQRGNHDSLLKQQGWYKKTYYYQKLNKV